MSRPNPLHRLFSRTARADDRVERESAALCDANLDRVRALDPDADRIFTVTFADAYRNDAAERRLTDQIGEYAAAKSAQNRMDLYHGIFAGLGD